MFAFPAGSARTSARGGVCATGMAEGVLHVGKAQERARVVRTERRHDPATGAGYPWRVPSTATVNQYYLNVFDDDFGPLFLNFEPSPWTPPTVTSQLHTYPTSQSALCILRLCTCTACKGSAKPGWPDGVGIVIHAARDAHKGLPTR